MLNTLLDPLVFFVFAGAALILGRMKAGPVRLVLFLIFNLVFLGWFFGRCRGLACYLAGMFLFWQGLKRVGPEKPHSIQWCAGLVVLLLAGLVAGKYVLPFCGEISRMAMIQIWCTISLSFLTFRLIHVVVDCHEGLIKRPDPLVFLNYVFFAPVSVAGPIQKIGEFERDLLCPRPMSAGDFVSAMQRLVFGIAKKVLIAAPLTPYVLGHMEPSGEHSLLMLAAACLLYSVYIYMDFSGYTDIAIGCAALFGIRLPENFDRPWMAVNLQDFWSRWHMTLTAWLRTYLFYPLNLFLVRRHPEHGRRLAPMAAVIVTFALAGLWHGNTWNFLVFGLLHGLGIAFHILIGRRQPSLPPSTAKVWLWRVLTFAYVSLAWIPFVYPLEEIPWLMGRAIGG
ncbi:MAG: MBOAT family protein [Verrucomicrobiae bacterium]|nr:MBOAT family protein [Verrucomicrobiae bacterium]